MSKDDFGTTSENGLKHTHLYAPSYNKKYFATCLLMLWVAALADFLMNSVLSRVCHPGLEGPRWRRSHISTCCGCEGGRDGFHHLYPWRDLIKSNTSGSKSSTCTPKDTHVILVSTYFYRRTLSSLIFTVLNIQA